MTRFVGPDSSGRFTRAEPGRWVTVYTDQACTTPATIGAYDPLDPTTPGAAITGSRLTVGSDKLIPLFWYPDGVRVLWGKLSRGADDAILRLNADYDSQFSAGGSGAVASVAGRTGAIVLTADDVSGVGANLSAIGSASTARTNLGLGAAALLSGVTDTSTAPLADGVLAASGSQTLGSPRDHVHGRYQWGPTDHNLLAWSCDPIVLSSTGTTGTAGTMAVTRIHLPYAATVTNMVWAITTAGGTLTSGQNFAALYKASDGSLVGATADQTSAWGSQGVKTMALSGGPYVCAAGDYYWAYWWNGSTSPGMLRGTVVTLTGSPTTILNTGLSAPNCRTATANTGLTTTAPGTLGTQTASTLFFWCALS